MSPANYPTITLKLPSKNIKRLATLLQRGFIVPCRKPISLHELLLGLPGFDLHYIENRIATIFIDGWAADSLRQLLEPGSTVALSAAMPGLAGAIFRKNSPHATLRSTPAKAPTQNKNQHGFLTIKLFNMVAADTVAPLLHHGILMKNATLSRFFRNREELLESLITYIYLDAASIPLNKPIHLPEGQPLFLVKANRNTPSQ